METDTLEKYLKLLNEKTDGKHNIGIYAADRLPRTVKKKPIALIVHSQKASQYIGHWFAIYVPKRGKPFYFDSFGRKPHIKTHINFLKRISNTFNQNEKCLQAPDSIVCGGYCLLFLAYKMGYIEQFFNCFTKNKERNDKFVEQAVEALIKNLHGMRYAF